MSVTLISNATVDKASLVYVAENGLVNMRNGAAITVVGAMADSTVNGHAAKGSGAAIDNYLSAQINGAVAADQAYAVLMVGTFTTSTDSAKPALWASGSSAARPKIFGQHSGDGRKVSCSCSYAGSNFVGYIPGGGAASWTSGAQYSLIVGRNTGAGIAGSINNAATVNGYNDATLRAATMAATDSLYFGGSPVLGGGETAQAGFAVSMVAFFVGVSPEELRTYIGADPWADKIVTISSTTTLSPGEGHLIFFGKQPAISQLAGSAVNPGTGHLILSGKQPSVAQSTTNSVSPGAGHIIFGGKQPALVKTVSVTTEPLTNENGGLLASTIIPQVTVQRVSDLGVVDLNLKNVPTNAQGQLVIRDATVLVGGNWYCVATCGTGAAPLCGNRSYQAS